MDQHPLHRTHLNLTRMGKVVGTLCCLWIGVVGWVAISQLSNDKMEHHATPVIQNQMEKCQGSYNARYSCADDVLAAGRQNGAAEILMRLFAIFFLPGIAWGIWRFMMQRTISLSKCTDKAQPDR